MDYLYSRRARLSATSYLVRCGEGALRIHGTREEHTRPTTLSRFLCGGDPSDLQQVQFGEVLGQRLISEVCQTQSARSLLQTPRRSPHTQGLHVLCLL